MVLARSAWPGACLLLRMKNDSTLLLRGQPQDATPSWVGEPGARVAQGDALPPWQEVAPPTSSTPAQDDTLVGGLVEAHEPVSLRLLASDSGALARLERDAFWRDALRRHATLGKPQTPTRRVEAVMAGEPPWSRELLETALEQAQARFAKAPVALVQGTVVVRFSDVERLRATLPELLVEAAEQPELMAEIERAKLALRSGGLAPIEARAQLETLYGLLQSSPDAAALRRGQVDRGLWVRRRFLSAELLGLPQCEAELRLDGDRRPLRAFLGQSLIDALYEGPSIRGRALIALELVDEGDAAEMVARVLTVARMRG